MRRIGARLSAAVALMLSTGVVFGAEKLVKEEARVEQKHSYTNRLAKEKSPYLLQHQHNPVEWYAWGNEAFEKARKENKPILLSIGYSTCHWCHVMERESFEDETLAKFLNERFVAIKVDREERPDVDKIYMTAMQAMGLGGGWPLNAFLTPELKPFYGGTYFPPQAKYGRPSFLQVLENVHELWTTRHGDVLATANDMQKQLQRITTQDSDHKHELSPAILERAARAFKKEYDSKHGGFGRAPKFPRPTQPQFLLRWGVRHNDKEAIKMVLYTCDAMAAGGMCDQLGGGFARYSVDEKWLVPHFEKMLYDNAQLIHLYLDAYLVSGEKRYADVARDIIRYVLRDMTHQDGGFFSAEDADSEGKEGKFYAWTKDEVEKLLTKEEAEAAIKYFGITQEGNFVDHSDPNPLPNQNVLSVVDADVAKKKSSALASAKKKMFEARAKRVRPHLDDKVLASWNGMMLGAIARAYAVLNEPEYLAAAEKNLRFLRSNLWDAHTKTLSGRWRDAQRDNVQLLEAYGNLAAGCIDLYEATLDPETLSFALVLAERILAVFYDSKEGGFFQSPAGASDLILRVKDDYDGAEPSGNSVATWIMLKLGKICERKDFSDAAEKTLRLLGERLQMQPQAVPKLLLCVDFALEEPKRCVIAGSEGKRLLLAAHQIYQPNKVVLGTEGPVEPFAKTLKSDGKARAFICTGTACRPPTSEPAALRDLLK
ncbi:MAG TPA: thioredoxin domain-containing protein [Verrucomicrobiae bacterium]|nr:thioredoxin domain-containing protein [Verrucomicrobiae bacterium]